MSSTFQSGYALLIGAGADLAFTVDDARGMADILKDPERCAYPPQQVELLTGEGASRQAVLDALDRLAKRSDESSTAVVYFSGHGYRASTPIGEAYFLIPFGVDMGRLKDTAISGQEFAAKLQAIRSKKLLLLLDCCHAGGVGLAQGLELAKSPLPPEALQILEAGTGRVIIASCMDSEFSYGGKPYSAFTLALIEALSGLGASKQDGFVRAADLALYAREKVPGRTKGRQHPIMHFEEADNFEIAYYAGGEAKPKGLPFTEEPEIEPEPGSWSGVFDQRGQTVQTQTNIAGTVRGPVFSGQFSGPVAMGGEAIDMRGSMGTIYKPTFNYNFPKPEEISRLPFIPDPPPNFTGRYEELKELKAQFDAGKTIIALHGFGGVGKTALSLKLVESIKDRYPGGQIIVDMRGTTNPISPMEAMGSVIRSYHREEKIPDSEAETRQRYLEVLKDKRALLLLDNALDDKQVLKLVPPKGCGLIITSRKTITIPDPFFFKMDLDVLKPGEALKLLLSVCCPAASPQKSTRDDPAWPEIARLCGFLPLALLAAASYLANSDDVSPKKYAKALADERSRLEMIGEQGVDMSVDASLALSFQKLETKLQQTFLDLSAFPADFDAQAEEQICLDQENKSLSELVRWSLVDYKPQGSEYGRYKLHDLARIFASARQQEEKKVAISERHAVYYKYLLSKANDLYLKGGESIMAGLALFDREEANILAGQGWAAKSMKKASSAAEICMSFPDAGVYFLDLRLHPRQMISWLEAALAAARKLRDRTMEGTHLGNLGNAYSDLGERRQAIQFYEQALKISREIGDRRIEGAALASLGNAYSDLGERRRAIEFYERALKISREIGDRRIEGANLGNLGNAYSDLGEPRKAIEFYEQALKISREIGDRRGEGIRLRNLGRAYSDLGERRRAIEFYEQALKIAQDIGDRRSEGNLLGNLQNAYSDLGERRRAIEFYEQALKIAQDIGDRCGEGNALANLGLAYSDLGEPRKAIEFYEQALKISREIGERQNEEADLGNLGNAYSDLGEPRKAIEFYEQALAIVREIADRQNESEFLCNLGKAYLDLKEVDKTIDNCTKSLDLARSMEYRKFEGEALCTLGKAFAAQDEPQKALCHCDQALKIFQEIEYPKGEAEALFAQSQALHQLGLPEAISCAQQALAIFQKIESPLAEKVHQQLADWGSPQET